MHSGQNELGISSKDKNQRRHGLLLGWNLRGANGIEIWRGRTRVYAIAAAALEDAPA